MDSRTPGFPVHHQLLELAKTHIHQVDDAIQQSHPLVDPFSSCLHLSQDHGLLQWVSSLPSNSQSIGALVSASVLPKNTQDWSPLEWTGWISLQSKGLSRVFSSITIQKHQLFADKDSSSQSYSVSSSHVWIWELDYKESWVPKNSCFWTVMLEKTLEVGHSFSSKE